MVRALAVARAAVGRRRLGALEIALGQVLEREGQPVAQVLGNLGDGAAPPVASDPNHVDEAGRRRLPFAPVLVLVFRHVGRELQILDVEVVAGQRHRDRGQDASPVEADHADFIVRPTHGPDLHLDRLLIAEPGQQLQVAGDLGRGVALGVALRHPTDMQLQKRGGHSGTELDDRLEQIGHSDSPAASPRERAWHAISLWWGTSLRGTGMGETFTSRRPNERITSTISIL